MDKTDFKIIKKLICNSRSSFRKIAIEIGVSTETVIRRYERLKKMGAIKPTINVDITKLGYEVRMWYMISLKSQINKSEIINKIAKIQDINRVIKAVGDYDLLVIAIIKDFKHMFEIGNKLNKIDGILRIEGRPYLPSDDPKILASAPSGFFNPNLLK